MTGGIIMKVLAKLKALFLAFGIIAILFGVLCIGCKSYIEDFRDDVKKKGISGITQVEYLGGKLSYDEFMDKSKEDIDTLEGGTPVFFVLGAGMIVLFIVGNTAAKKQKNG